jgi:ribosomal protein L23
MLIYPVATEKAINQIAKSNTIVFEVEKSATKKLIWDHVEKEFQVKVADVRINNTFSGKKRAFVKLKKEFSAMDVASKLKIL